MAEVEQDVVPETVVHRSAEDFMNEVPPSPRNASPAHVPHPPRKRPRLDLTTEPRKRGKTMFGILVGTLNKAKDEDAERNKTDAARRRMSLETKLQSKLAHEQMEVRRQADIKRSRMLASHKEDELVMKDNLLRLTHEIKPYLSHFLITSDHISHPTNDPFSLPISIPPPAATQTVLYYLPAILLPEQEAFLKTRQEGVREQVGDEQKTWKEERKKGIEEVDVLRQQVQEFSNQDVLMEGEKLSEGIAYEDSVTLAFAEAPPDPNPSINKAEVDDAEALEY